ncbi:dihydrodipicolinate synthase family protein [Capsulimonas corticalis]|uniref:Dihydrodipicolinate synthase family protein n=1 Tax=Capsulimonas corticalis TaxID=2219043 RepID=A0A402D6I4_9BACT|nr:dihydrodipicolinate synthase family protein [Capsulimonas corticalis]BDI32451.1 dihydrodipicolinate synthase family protein [Capsulimonas corticalis]
MKPTWTGVFPALTTHLHEDQTLDLDATAKHIEVMIESGVQGLVMLGSLGENAALEADEKRRVMEMTVDVARGRVPVLSGVSETSTAAACRYARDMERLGADGLMVLPAMVYKSDPSETMIHFRAVADASDLPIICYNNPIAYGVDITPAMFAQLADEEKFVAIKESSGNTCRISDIINLVGDRYMLFTGVDDLALESIMLGAKGWIAGIGLAFPKENQYLWDLAMAGEWEKARELYRWYMPLLHLDVSLKFVQNIKLCIQECGLGAEWVRAPRQPLAGAEREAVLKVIRHGLANRPSIPTLALA